MTHPAVVKAGQIGRIAAEHGWKGNLDSKVVEDKRITVIKGQRKDESFCLTWENNHLVNGTYSFFSKSTQIHSASQALTFICGKPDLARVFKKEPVIDRLDVVERYRELPFDVETATESEIITALSGRTIYWYSPITGKIWEDVVQKPTKKKAFEVRNVANGKRMFNFIGQQGFRSVLLDQLFKVG